MHSDGLGHGCKFEFSFGVEDVTRTEFIGIVGEDQQLESLPSLLIQECSGSDQPRRRTPIQDGNALQLD